MYEELYLKNRVLLHVLARKYAGACAFDRAVDIEDLAQAGFFGLVRAAQTYKPDYGKSWSGWAAWYIQSEFRNVLGLRDGRPTRAHSGADSLDRPVRLDRTVSADDASGVPLGELLPDESLPDPDAEILRAEAIQAIREAVAALPDSFQREAIRMTRLQGKTIAETAQALGQSETATRNHIQRAMVHLHKDRRLRTLAGLDEQTRFVARKGLAAFRRDHSSVVEDAVIWREEWRERHGENSDKTI